MPRNWKFSSLRYTETGFFPRAVALNYATDVAGSAKCKKKIITATDLSRKETRNQSLQKEASEKTLVIQNTGDNKSLEEEK